VGPDVPRALASHVLKVPAKKKGKQTVLAKLGFDVSGCVVADATLETQYEEDVPPPKAPPKSKPPPPPPAAAEEGKGAEGGGEGKDGDADMKEGGKDDGKESGGGGEGNDAKREKKDKKDEKEEEEAKQPPQKRMVTRREKLDLEQVLACECSAALLMCACVLTGIFCHLLHVRQGAYAQCYGNLSSQGNEPVAFFVCPAAPAYYCRNGVHHQQHITSLLWGYVCVLILLCTYPHTGVATD
jgi:hypothetical protein